MDFLIEQIAPCGMNCALCSAFLARTHAIPKARGRITHCLGCRIGNKRCAFLKKQCEKLLAGTVGYCYECEGFPCERLARIDRRYRRSYSTSLIENLEQIRDFGIDAFFWNQKKRFLCPNCKTDVVSVHNGKCYSCDRVTSWRS